MGNNILRPITADGYTGFDQFNQLMTRTAPDANGYWTMWMIGDVRGETCCICGQKWKTSQDITTAEMQNQTTRENGRLLMHKTCYDGYARLTERNFWLGKMYTLSVPFEITELNVRYPHSTPWYRIDIKNYDKERSLCGVTLIVGRRKSVWEIRYSNTPESLKELLQTVPPKTATDGEWDMMMEMCPEDSRELVKEYKPETVPATELDAVRKLVYLELKAIMAADFSDVTDTKGVRYRSDDDPDLGPHAYVHAWSGEQVTDYLKRFAAHFPATTNYEYYNPKTTA